MILLVVSTPVTAAEHGEILDQDLNGQGQGYTVLRVWGSHYEMGHAQAELLGDAMVDGLNQVQAYVGGAYESLRQLMAVTVWMPPEIEDEFDGIVDCLAVSHPEEDIDELDVKVACTLGEWLYGCRSHTCWGRYVADPVRTLSTRRLDFSTVIPMMTHHVLCAYEPDNGSPRWVSLTWPGIITLVQGVNEFGTLVSLHDYKSGGADLTAGRMPRMVAARYALTYATDPDVSTHLPAVWDELRGYEIMTGSFVNYYAPEGWGGVMTGWPWQSGPDFHHLRPPHPDWHHGEAMITTNMWTDGSYTPGDENFGADAYYDEETPKTMESHWDLLADAGNGLQQLSVACRGRGDLTIWADGRLSYGRTPRLEYEWSELFPCTPGDVDGDGDVDTADLLLLLGAWGDCPGCPEDINEDGVVNTADLLILLGNWG
ncbi:MAG: hypothetical protein SYC29_07755 [Planctomycetota bacterium]|nr:hypothetical protein [Planctomycetota bacterium]